MLREKLGEIALGDQRDITSLLDVSDPHRQDGRDDREVFIAGGSVLTTSGVNDKSNEEC